MIEVEGLSKSYGDYRAVRGVSFTAGQGQVVGFLGPNGAGKTSTIRMLATYLPPSSGTARVAGFDILTHPDEVRRRIGYLPENPPLYGEMTVREYLLFVGSLKGIPKQQLRAKVDDSLERCFLTDVQHKLCQHLSRGYRQRTGLAQAIIHDPAVIILDEPTSGLDPKQIIEIRKFIKALGEKHTVLLSTHILPEVSMVCSKVVIVHRGQVVADGMLEDLTRTKSLEQVFLEKVAGDIEHEIGAEVAV
jgi:ABC-2 type transport system ATP-binding protein